jgi:hypothetical protein
VSAENTSGLVHWLGLAADVTSAFLGMAGTCLMSRRYAQKFWVAFLLALVFPLQWLRGKSQLAVRVRERMAQINSDIPPSARDMAAGLTMIFWAFFLQLLARLIP